MLKRDIVCWLCSIPPVISRTATRANIYAPWQTFMEQKGHTRKTIIARPQNLLAYRTVAAARYTGDLCPHGVTTGMSDATFSFSIIVVVVDATMERSRFTTIVPVVVPATSMQNWFRYRCTSSHSSHSIESELRIGRCRRLARLIIWQSHPPHWSFCFVYVVVVKYVQSRFLWILLKYFFQWVVVVVVNKIL